MKENSKKTILFRQREEHHISKYRFSSKQNGKSDFKVIPYPKYKKSIKKIRKFLKLKNISIILIVILVASIYFSLNNKRLSYLRDKTALTPVSTSSQNTVSNDEFNTYSKIIKTSIDLIFPLTTEHSIKTESIHKNGSYIYGQGFIYTINGDTLYFDITLKNDETYSLIVNDIEYVKK